MSVRRSWAGRRSGTRPAATTPPPPSRPEPGPGRPVRSGPQRTPLPGPGPRAGAPLPEPQGPDLRVVLVSRDNMLAGALRSLIMAPGGVKLLDWHSQELDAAIRHADVVIIDMPPSFHERTFAVLDGRFQGRIVVLLQEGEHAEALPPGPPRIVLYRPLQIGELWSAITGAIPPSPGPGEVGVAPGVAEAEGREAGVGVPEAPAIDGREPEVELGEPEAPADEAGEPEIEVEEPGASEVESGEPAVEVEDPEAAGDAPGEPGIEVGDPEAAGDDPERRGVEVGQAGDQVGTPEDREPGSAAPGDGGSEAAPEPAAAAGAPGGEAGVTPAVEEVAQGLPVEDPAQGLPVAESGRLIGLSGRELEPTIGPGQVAPGMDEATLERLHRWRSEARQLPAAQATPQAQRRSSPTREDARAARAGRAEARRTARAEAKAARSARAEARREQARQARRARAEARQAARAVAAQAKAAQAQARKAAEAEAAKAKAAEAEARKAAEAEADRAKAAEAEARKAAQAAARQEQAAQAEARRQEAARVKEEQARAREAARAEAAQARAAQDEARKAARMQARQARTERAEARKAARAEARQARAANAEARRAQRAEARRVRAAQARERRQQARQARQAARAEARQARAARSERRKAARAEARQARAAKAEVRKSARAEARRERAAKAEVRRAEAQRARAARVEAWKAAWAEARRARAARAEARKVARGLARGERAEARKVARAEARQARAAKAEERRAARVEARRVRAAKAGERRASRAEASRARAAQRQEAQAARTAQREEARAARTTRREEARVARAARRELRARRLEGTRRALRARAGAGLVGVGRGVQAGGRAGVRRLRTGVRGLQTGVRAGTHGLRTGVRTGTRTLRTGARAGARTLRSGALALARPVVVVLLLAGVGLAAAGWRAGGGPDTLAGEVAAVRAGGSPAGGLVAQDPRVGPIEPLHALGVGAWLRASEAGGSLQAVVRAARVPSRWMLAVAVGLTVLLSLLLMRVGPGSGAAAGPGPAPPQPVRAGLAWRLGVAAVAGGLVALDPLVVRGGRAATGTILALALALGTLVLAWAVPSRPVPRWLPAVAAAGGLALLVSPLALPVLAVPTVAALLEGRYQEAWRTTAALGLSIGLWLLLPVWVAGQELGAGQAGWLLGRPPGRGSLAASLAASPLSWLLVAAGLAAAALTWRPRSGARPAGAATQAARRLAWVAATTGGALAAMGLGYPVDRALPYAVPAAAVALAFAAGSAVATAGTAQARRLVLAGTGVALAGLLAAQGVDWGARYRGPADDGLGRLVATVASQVPACSAVNVAGPDAQARLLAAGVTVTGFTSGPAAHAAGIRYFVLTGDTAAGPPTPGLGSWVRQRGTRLAGHPSRSLPRVELWRVDAAPLDPVADHLPVPGGIFSNVAGSACGGYRVIDRPEGAFHTAYVAAGGKPVLGRPLGSVWTSDGPALQAFDTMVLGAAPAVGGDRPAVRPIELPPLLAKLNAEAVADADIPLPSARPPASDRQARALLGDRVIARAYLGADPAAATAEDWRRARERFGRPLGRPQVMPDGAVRQTFERVVLELPADGGAARPAALGRLAVRLGLVPRQATRLEPVPGLPAGPAETRLDPGPLLRWVAGLTAALVLASALAALAARRARTAGLGGDRSGP